MSTHNIRFPGEIRKISLPFSGKSGAMLLPVGVSEILLDE